MVELRLGKIDNTELKFIPTKKEYLEEYLNSIEQIEEYELTQTFKDNYKYRCYNDHGKKKYTKNKKMKTKQVTTVKEIKEEEFNKVLKENNNKCIKKIRKYYLDGDYEIDVDYFSKPLELVLVEVASNKDLNNYIPPRGFIDVTKNDLFQNKNIYNSSIISNNTIIEGTDGVGKTTTISALLKEGIIAQDRCMDVISKNMLFEIPLEERAKLYNDYLKTINKKIIIMVNNDEEELMNRINKRKHLSEFDKDAYKYNKLYLETFNYMKDNNLLENKMYLVDVTHLTIEEQTNKITEIINKD